MADVSLLTRKLIQSVSKLSESRIKMPLAVGDIVKEKQVISGNVAISVYSGFKRGEKNREEIQSLEKWVGEENRGLARIYTAVIFFIFYIIFQGVDYVRFVRNGQEIIEYFSNCLENVIQKQ